MPQRTNPMQLLHSVEQLALVPAPVHLAIGVFDGVHLGHQAVINRAIAAAHSEGGSSVVLTFHPHPMRVLRPEKAPRLLTSTQHKTLLIEQLGVTALLLQEFSIEFSRTPPRDFVLQLLNYSKALKTICVGEGWSFGANRSGSVDLLRELAAAEGFGLEVVEPIVSDAQVISSTRIREAIERGELGQAAKLLGRAFTVLGTVTEGNRLGRQLGFPTANLRTHNEQFPPDGVYAVKAWHRNTEYGGVVNIGVRPTLEQARGERILEIHLFDFEQEIYGEDIEASFLQYLRPEKKFDSLGNLREQIQRDAAMARVIYQERKRVQDKDQ
jgi:riboflavin kinase / FMN adenylyltransferase